MGPAHTQAEVLEHAGMELIGRRFGHIRVVNVVGEGGMGEIYAGFDEKLQRKVALKALHADQRLDGEARERLLREARALSTLDHPNICRIFDYIESGDVDLLVLEYIEGKTLHEALDERLSHHEKLRISIAIAEVLVAAHRVGIIHRDLKPENIMLTRSGEVKVLDFGLARWLTTHHSSGRRRNSSVTSAGGDPAQIHLIDPWHAMDDPEATAVLNADEVNTRSAKRRFLMTAAGVTMGTPLYMSPEQARGETLTPASDMYSFGLLLQTLFTGAEPYPAESTAREVMIRASRGDSLPIEGVVRDVAALLSRLKQIAPSDRFTAVEALARLRYIADKPKRVVRYSAITAAVLMVVIGVWRYTVDLEVERSAAVEARKNERSQRAKAEDLINFMVGDLRKKLEPVGRLDILDDVAERALSYAGGLKPEQLSPEELARNVQALNQLGEVRIGQGRLPDAAKVFGQSLALARAGVRRHPSSPKALFALSQSEFWVGNAYRLQGDAGGALRHMRNYLTAADKLAALDPKSEEYQMERAFGHSSVGTILDQNGDLRGSLEHYRVTMEIKQALASSRPADLERQFELARTTNKVGFVLQRLGDLQGAQDHYERELAMREALVRADGRQVPWKKELAVTHSFLSSVLIARGRDAEAMDHYRSELALESELRAHDPANVGWRRNEALTRMRISDLLRRDGRAAEALAGFEASERTLAELIAGEPQRSSWKWDLVTVQTAHAYALLAAGRAGEALAIADKAASWVAKQPPDPATAYHVADAYLARAAAEERNGNPARARADREAATATLELVAPAATNTRVRDAWARALLASGRTGEACAVRDALARNGYFDRDMQNAFATAGCPAAR